MHGQMDSAALLNHIVQQTRANIDFLVAQHQISEPDAKLMISKLPSPTDPHIDSLVNDTQNLLVRAPPPPPPSAASYGAALPKARAIWGYNEDRADPNDLHFRAGDVIEIVAETNGDWWTGRNHGSEGLFPANYVERIASEPTPPPPQRGPTNYDYNSPPSFAPPSGPPMPYQPYQPPQQYQSYQPPPPQAYQSQYQAPPPQPVMTQQPEPAKDKKNKFGGMGNTLATAAVGGVGFGAGSAVGSGIINSIF